MAFVNFKPMLHTTFFSVLWMFSPAWKDHFTDITAGTVVTFLSEMKPHSGPFPHLLHHCFVWRLWCSLFAICGCQKNIWGYNSRSLSVAISMVLFRRDIRFVIAKDKEKNRILTVTRLKSEKNVVHSLSATPLSQINIPGLLQFVRRNVQEADVCVTLRSEQKQQRHHSPRYSQRDFEAVILGFLKKVT